jgi:hypothetical protein
MTWPHETDQRDHRRIYRIAEFWPEYGITINQFLIVDERPTLDPHGTHPMYDGVRRARWSR